MDAGPIVSHHPLAESLPETRRSGLRLKRFRKDCVDFHWHFHPEVELIQIRQGSGVRYVGRSVEPFRAGDFCLIGSNVPHAFGSHPSERQGAEWTVGHFLPSVWGEAFWRLPEMRRVTVLLDQARHGVGFPAESAAECARRFDRLVRTPAGAARLAAWLELLAQLAVLPGRRILNPAPLTGESMDRRLQTVLAWVETHAGDPDLSQARAARQIHQSPQAFSRFFHQATGRVFQRYVSEVRVARACGDLLNSEVGISQIAFQSGFNNLANFNRRFREITGCTPREYRRMEGGLHRGREAD